MTADVDDIGPQVLAALERRHAMRRGEEPPRRIPALVIARRFGIRAGSSDDSRKKGVRNLIRQLRENGAPVLSDLRGYYMGGEPADFVGYAEFRRRSGLAHLVAGSAASRSEPALDAGGQLGLFNVPARAAR